MGSAVSPYENMKNKKKIIMCFVVYHIIDYESTYFLKLIKKTTM